MNISEAYKILGLNERASADEVKAAYKSLAQTYSSSAYQTGPLKDDAEKHLEEITQAFDIIMVNIRTGNNSNGPQSQGSYGKNSSTAAKYANIRNMINHGKTDEALSELNSATDEQNAEWNFLVGSAYYYKGWVNDAMRYFQNASRLDPTNREYSNALNNLKSNQNGNMHGNPYQNRGANYGSPVACSCCDMCAAFMCMDLCCNCGGC